LVQLRGSTVSKRFHDRGCDPTNTFLDLNGLFRSGSENGRQKTNQSLLRRTPPPAPARLSGSALDAMHDFTSFEGET
jgi:hypothetical protein